jgi:hypothetical protein
VAPRVTSELLLVGSLPADSTETARVFLGIVLPIDGIPGLTRRHATASKFLDDFGVAMYCGFGRQPGRDGDETMREHAETVRALLAAA